MVTALYGSQYRSLVRLAVLLLGGDVRAAEEIAQASFVALHGAWPRPRDRDAAVAFLRRAVVSRSRQLRRPSPMSDPTTETNRSAATMTATMNKPPAPHAAARRQTRHWFSVRLMGRPSKRR